MKQICQSCRYYSARYTKGYDCFNDTCSGICFKSKANVKNRQTCELWRDDTEKRETRKNFSLTTLERAVDYIRDIAQILREEQEEQKRREKAKE